MKNKALLVYNPHSGNDQSSREEIFERIRLSLLGHEIVIFEIEGENVTQRLTDFLDQIRPDLVIVAGGDGTVKLAANSLRSQIPLAIIPLGSANGLAKCLGISNLEDGLEALRNLEIFRSDAILIDNELCLHLADFGFNASMINKFEQGDTRGMLGYIKSSITEVFNTQTCRFRIEWDTEHLDIEAKMLVIGNGEEYGTGALINAGGRMDDGKFEIIAVEFNSPGDLISITKSMVTGETQDESTLKTWCTDSCKIFNLDLANFQIDGELRGNPEFITVKIQKGAFDFVIKS